MREHDSNQQKAVKVLLCGGLAGVVTWASIFPLDAIKTRVQTWDLLPHAHGTLIERTEAQALLSAQQDVTSKISMRPSTFRIARQAYEAEGAGVFFRGLGICSARAFVVNAVQWAVSISHYQIISQALTARKVYEWMMNLLAS